MLGVRYLSRRSPSPLARGGPRALAACAFPRGAAPSRSPANQRQTSPAHLRGGARRPTPRAFSSSGSGLRDAYDHVLVERRFPDAAVVGGGVGVVTLRRPAALNALSDALFADLVHALRALDADDAVGCLVITGSGKAFAAGERRRWCRVRGRMTSPLSARILSASFHTLSPTSRR